MVSSACVEDMSTVSLWCWLGGRDYRLSLKGVVGMPGLRETD